MKISNKYKLPENLYQLLARDYYTPGKDDYSVTELISPPQMVQLKRRHWHELQEDAVDRFWTFLGHMAHKVMEENTESGAEKRLYTPVSGRILSGQMDHHDNGVITDYKVTSVWTLTYGDRVPEWTKQLNLYAYLARSNSLPVVGIQIIAMLRDWTERATVPPINIIPINMWPMELQEKYTRDQMELHINSEKLEDCELPHCSSEDMWEKPTTYAVMKKGRKRALRLFNTFKEADTELFVQKTAQDQGVFYIEKRPGERTRCLRYCPISGFCNQWSEYNGRQEDQTSKRSDDTEESGICEQEEED